jgi:conjugal transfer pilus assembly protein TraW
MKYYSRIIGYTVVLLGVLVFGIMLLFGGNNKAEAKDLGVHGQVWEIKEKDIVSYIKYQITEEKAEKIQKDFIAKSKKHINRPKPVGGITKTLEHKVHYYNPEITLTKDVADQTGKVLYKKGTKVNPLDHQTFTRQLLFINGDDIKQVEFAVSKYHQIGEDLKIVLTNGSPIELMKKYNPQKGDISSKNNLQIIRFYFDQEGYLSKTFGIEAVPSLVKKEGKLMRVEAIVLGER